jgi:hypothetical protein
MIDVKLAAKSFFKCFYSQEPCRICGQPIGEDKNAVYAGYSLDSKSRSAHYACWSARKHQKSEWIYPEDGTDT